MTLDQTIRSLGRSNDPENIRGFLQNILRHSYGASVLAGVWCRTDSLNRQLIPLAVRENVNRDFTDEWMFWAVLLLPPASPDATVLLNVLSGLADAHIWTPQMKSSALLHLVADFLLHALTQSALVAERTIDLLAVLPSDVLATLPKVDRILDAARHRVAVIDDQIVKEELTRCIDDAASALALTFPGRTPSVGRLRVDIADAISALQGGEAAEFAHLGLHRLEAYLIGLSRENEVRLVQRVRFRSARDNDTVLDDRRVGAGFNAWSKFNEWWITTLSGQEARMMPAGAAVGSFQLDLILESDGEQAKAILRAADQVAEITSGEVPLPEAGRWGQLVEVLTEFGLTMTVAHYWGIQESKTIEFSRNSMKAVQRRVQEGPARAVESVDVPQANVLEKVFEVAESVSGLTPLDMDVRDINYYRRAAKILGLIDEKTDTLTAAGRQTVRLDVTDRLRAAVVLFETSNVGEAWISFCGGKSLMDVSPDTAEDFLAQRSSLTGDTIRRRARALRAWHATLIKHHYLNRQAAGTAP